MAKKPSYEELEQRVKELEDEAFDRKQAEESLRESDERYTALFDRSLDCIYIHDFEGNFIDANPAALKLFGYTREEILSLNFASLLGQDQMSLALQTLEKVKKDGFQKDITEFKLTVKSGEHIYIETKASLLYHEGEPYAIQGIGRDITARKRSEEALRESEERYRTILESIEEIYFEVDIAGNFTFFNDSLSKSLGYSNDELAGMNNRDYMSPESLKKIYNLFNQMYITGNPIKKVVYEIIRKDRSRGFHEMSASLMKDQAGQPIGFRGIAHDITERTKAEEALRESEEKYRLLIENATDAIFIAQDGVLKFANPKAEEMTGYSAEELAKIPAIDIVHPEDRDMALERHLKRLKDEGIPSIYSLRILNRSGKELSVELNAVLISWEGRPATLSFLRDITAQKRLEAQLQQARKMEAIAILAGGIAHDFNNLMSAVVGNISLARIEMKPGSKGFKNLVEAEKASIQTKELTARLITFSEGGGPVKKTASIGDLVKNSVDSSLKGSDIDAGFSIPDDISPVEVDEEQMKQAIHNIITNAKEAMAGQGTINVSCENVNIGEKDTLTLKNGKYVKISIEDQGPGIPEEDLAKIFDPYFSTKEMGTQKGMGLGLAISDSIVKKHDGLITVESQLGTGTTFFIYLPASEKEIIDAAPVKKPVPEKLVTRGGKILVMDDEEMVRDVTNALLTHLGYEAEVAVDGIEAIEMYRKAMESGKPYDLVILDLTNNFGMGGVETIKRLLEIDPDVRAIVATGYSNDPIISNFREHGFRGSLSKPFSLDQLKTALSEVIAGE